MTLEDAIKHAKEVARENRYRIKHVLFHNNDIDEINACIECAEEHEQLAIWLAELKRYKELKENGRLIELPCVVGDTVYDIAGKEIRKQIVDGVEYTKDGFFIYANEDEWIGMFGDLVFLTKEEAEAKLKELRGEQE